MFKVDNNTLDAIRDALQKKEESSFNARVLLTGMGWSGPKFGLSLDKKNEDDYEEIIDDVTIIMERDIAEMFDDITIIYKDEEFVVDITGNVASC